MLQPAHLAALVLGVAKKLLISGGSPNDVPSRKKNTRQNITPPQKTRLDLRKPNQKETHFFQDALAILQPLTVINASNSCNYLVKKVISMDEMILRSKWHFAQLFCGFHRLLQPFLQQIQDATGQSGAKECLVQQWGNGGHHIPIWAQKMGFGTEKMGRV